ncbi:shikimate kinase [Kaarinaea lacus]
MPQNIIFVGPMGAGKTTIGRQIAKALGRTFYDSDKEIEKRTGATIPLIFELEKEAGFRLRESAMIKELLSKDNTIVLATGGGAVLSEKNRKLMARHGFVIYLCAPLEQLVRRTARDKNRPLLQTKNPKKTIEDLLSIRDPLYREVADLVFETDGFTVRQVVSKLQKLVKGKNL